MSLKKKHRIKKVEKKDLFETAASIIMNSKLQIVKKQIKNYFKEDSVDNLHTMRISIRRMRYSMELFHGCFDKKLYKNVYNRLKKMQDVVGQLRDLDVLEEKIRSVDQKDDVVIPDMFYKNIISEKNEIRRTIKSELIKFAEDKQVNQFSTKRVK
jgi:CHAD domain-containing protein